MKSSRFSFVTNALRTVYSHPVYWVITILAGVGYFVLATWLPQHSLITYTLTTRIFDVPQKLEILATSLGWVFYNGTLFTEVLFMTTTTLVGINIAFLIYYFAWRSTLQRMTGIGAAASVLGLFGLGCGTCGSVLLSSIFGITAAGSIAALLPLHGLEFGIISLILLVVSIGYMARSICSPLTCNT